MKTSNKISIPVFLPVAVLLLVSCTKPKGNNPSSTISRHRIEVPVNEPTISLANENAKDGDTIILDPGIYKEAVQIQHKVVFGSKYITTGDTSYISKTIIQGDGQSTGFGIGTGTLIGLTLKGCTIVMGNNSVSYCNIYGYQGFGISISQWDAANIDHCTISHNLGGISEAGNATMNLSNSSIILNGVDKSLYFNPTSPAGGIILTSNARISNCLVSDNISYYSGGGLSTTTFSGSNPININVSHTVIKNNGIIDQGSNGGGVFFKNNVSAYFDSCTFSGNYTSAGYITTGGTSGDGGGIFLGNNCGANFTGDSFINNSAFALGGAVYGSNNANTEFLQCRFIGNSAEGEGVIGCNLSGVQLEECLFVNNKSLNARHSNKGFEPIIQEVNGYLVRNCTFYNNKVNSDNFGALMFTSLCPITNTIAWGNTPTNAILNSPGINYCDCDTAYNLQGKGNFKTDPLFNNPAQMDFTLKTNSPLVGAGDPAYPDANGKRRNIGAY